MDLRIIALLIALGTEPGTPTPQAAARLEVVYESGTFEGTCALIYAEPSEDAATLYFVTSSRLFKTPHGQAFLPPRTVRVILANGDVIPVPRGGIVLPMGTLVDVAILRVTAPTAPLAPTSLNLDTPSAGEPFEVAGYDREGLPASVPQHVRFRSTRLVVGDRDASGLAGCVGAPALNADGIYGIVSECDANRPPVVTLLSMACALLARTIPGALARTTLRNQR
jgi:hypothetical protein